MVNVDRKQKEIYSGNQGSVEMKVNLGQAVKMFFSNSSLEMVYFEAIANALDAGATKISIEVSGKSIKDHKALILQSLIMVRVLQIAGMRSFQIYLMLRKALIKG